MASSTPAAAAIRFFIEVIGTPAQSPQRMRSGPARGAAAVENPGQSLIADVV